MRIRVSAIIIRDEEVLTLHYQYSGNDVYALPGGNPDKGETLEDAVLRELKEEIQVDALSLKLILVGEVTSWEGHEDALHCIFLAEIGEAKPILDPKHSSAQGLEWLPVEGLGEKTLYPNVGEVIKNVKAEGFTFYYIGEISQPYH